ncbi:MAG: hypothetical protein QM820_11000 [Minicystis sp.]
MRDLDKNAFDDAAIKLASEHDARTLAAAASARARADEEASWDELRRRAAERIEGQRILLPVLGAGFNEQAGKGKNWRALLDEIRQQEALDLDIPAPDDVIGNSTLVWEAMLLELAHKRNLRPEQIERDLQEQVATVLDRAYTVGGVTKDLATRFLGARFSDVLSFNFDRGLHLEEPVWFENDPGHFDPIHSYAKLSDGTRVWYPHGATRDPKSILLGMRKYGVMIHKLEDGRQQYKKLANQLKARMYPGVKDDLPADKRESFWWAHRTEAASWVTTAMNAPLLFIGLGLGREEWPLW